MRVYFGFDPASKEYDQGTLVTFVAMSDDTIRAVVARDDGRFTSVKIGELMSENNAKSKDPERQKPNPVVSELFEKQVSDQSSIKI